MKKFFFGMNWCRTENSNSKDPLRSVSKNKEFQISTKIIQFCQKRAKIDGLLQSLIFILLYEWTKRRLLKNRKKKNAEGAAVYKWFSVLLVLVCNRIHPYAIVQCCRYRSKCAYLIFFNDKIRNYKLWSYSN